MITDRLKYLFVLCLIFSGFTLGAIDIYLKQVNLPREAQASGINLVLPDSAGFIWLGTDKGLYRWDGNRIEEFPVSENSKPLNISSLTLDLHGNVWAGCTNGSIYFVSDQSLQNWKPADTGSFTKITDLLFDKDGKLWWGTNGSGLFYYNEDKTISLGLEDGLPDMYIYSLEKGNYGEIWASTDRGVAVCKSRENLQEISFYDKASGLSDDIVRVVKKDQKGKIWLGFQEGGVCFFNKKLANFIAIQNASDKSFGQVNSISVDRSGIWVASGKGLQYLCRLKNSNTFEEVIFHGENHPSKIEAVTTDKFGNLWILDKEGLFVSSAGAFTRIERKFNYDITSAKAIAAANKNSVWLAGNNEIVEITKEGSKRFLSDLLKTTSGITSMKEDADGNFWITTFGDGVIVFNPTLKKHRFITEKQGLVNNNALDISIHGNMVWVATLGGASRIINTAIWEEKTLNIQSYDKEHGLGNNFIYSILQDKKGDVWFGTDGNGLVKFKDDEFIFFDENSGLDDDVVYSIAEDHDGNIWLSTAFSGLYSFDGNSFKNYSISDGLLSNTIFSLACQDDFVFILTDLGLDVYNKTTEIFTSINEELGLRKLKADLNKVYSTNEFICFVTEQGIIRINTNRYSAYAQFPQLTIDKVLVNLETRGSSTISQLSYDENKIQFEYSGFWYLAPSKVRYLVRLDGYDPDWKTTYDRRVSYANLAPGNYTFEIKAFLDNVSTEVIPLSLGFQILKPVYTRWWFILLLVIVALAVLSLMIRSREKRLKNIENRNKEKLEFEFQTLKNQINPHFLFNSFSTLISMIEENPDVAVEYTEQLSDFFRNILDVIEHELISMEEELEMMQNYFYIQHKRFGENFSLKIVLDENAKNSKIPPLTLQLLTENAIKHNVVSKNKPLSIKISSSEKFIFVLNNLQKKKQTEKSTGVGLQNIKERYRLLSGKEVTVQESQQFFKVILPIIKS